MSLDPARRPPSAPPGAPSATGSSELPAWLGEESVLDALDLDPRASLAELAEQLRELSTSADPSLRERARRAFERLAERPEAHFVEVLKAVPRQAAERRPSPRAVSPSVPALSIAALLPPPSLDARLGPEAEGERAWLSPPRHLGHPGTEGA